MEKVNYQMRILFSLTIGGLIAVFATLGLESGCLPSSYPKPELVGVWKDTSGGALQGIVVQGPTAFLIESNFSPTGRLVCIDISNPAHPREIGSARLMETVPTDITIKENYIYVVDYYLEIFDVSNPSSPQRVGSIDLKKKLLAVEIKEDVVYAFNERDRAIEVVDVSDPTDPTFIRSVPVRQDYPVFNIDIHGNLAFLANSGGGISVLDLETPLDPVFLSSFDPEGGVVVDVKAKEQFAFFPKSSGPQADFSKLFVIDASNPAQMEFVTSLEIGMRESIAKSIAIDGSIAAIAMQNPPFSNVLLVDISDPTSPQEKGHGEIPSETNTPQGDIWIQEGLIFVTGIEGLAIYEIVYE